MIQVDKLPEQTDFSNITDYSTHCPAGKKSFFAYVYFTDHSYTLWSNIYADSRLDAHLAVIDRFYDCLDHIQNISLHESQD